MGSLVDIARDTAFAVTHARVEAESVSCAAVTHKSYREAHQSSKRGKRRGRPAIFGDNVGQVLLTDLPN